MSTKKVEAVDETAENIPVKPGEKTVRIKIHKDRGDKSTHQFVSVNDRNFLVKKGEWVDVPECVAEVLNRRDQRMEASEAYIETAAKKSAN